MFEFIQLCIKLINMAYVFSNTKYASYKEQDEAFKVVSDFFYNKVCKFNVYKANGKKYDLGLYWRYTTETVYRNAFAHYVGRPSYVADAAFSSVNANIWAAHLGYEIVGV